MNNQRTSLRICSLNDEQPMQASKWLKNQVLLDSHEMELFLNHLEEQRPLYIFLTGCLIKPGEGLISKPQFLETYAAYINDLKEGSLPNSEAYRQLFSAIFTHSLEALYEVALSKEKHLIRTSKPVVQLQAHSFDYSEFDGKFRPMVLGSESVLWGLQFSYPQIFQNSRTKEVEQIGDTDSFPNTKLFRTIQKWLRQNTLPTPFLVEDRLTNVPMRIGKECLNWINKHPQLLKKNIKVKM